MPNGTLIDLIGQVVESKAALALVLAIVAIDLRRNLLNCLTATKELQSIFVNLWIEERARQAAQTKNRMPQGKQPRE